MMKRTMALGAAVAITGAAAISCDNPSWAHNNDTSKTSPESVDSTKTGPAVETHGQGNYDFEPDYLRVGSLGRADDDPVVISSVYALKAYAATTTNGTSQIGLAAPRYDGDGNLINERPWYEFAPVIEKYTDDYFINNFLVIVPKLENSGSIRHKVGKVEGNGNIYIERIVPEITEDDMANWYIVIPQKNEDRLSAYNAVFIDYLNVKITDPVGPPITPVIEPPVPVPCGASVTDSTKDYITNCRPPVVTDAISYEARADYVRLGNVERRGETPVVITSAAELERYAYPKTADDGGKIGLAAPEYGDREIRGPYYEYAPIIEKYTGDFFKNDFLIIVPRTEPSGSIRHNFERVDVNGNIFIDRIWPCADCAFTEDVVSSDIVIPLPKDGRLNNYRVIITEFTDEESGLVKK